MWYIIVLIIGVIMGMAITSMCVVAKQADEPNETMRGYSEARTLTFKDTLSIILKGDIDLYTRLYKKSNNIYYYLGRIKECEFILKLVKGDSDETREC